MFNIASYDIVFAEIPGEVTLALNLSGCPNGCEGCHSPHLREDVGEPLTDDLLLGLLDGYGRSVTCVAFMGGDADPGEVERLARMVRAWNAPQPEISGGNISGGLPTDDMPVGGPSDGHSYRLKTAWYSGRETMPALDAFDYVKLGPWVAAAGGLDSPTTNQRLYRIDDGYPVDITRGFLK